MNKPANTNRLTSTAENTFRSEAKYANNALDPKLEQASTFHANLLVSEDWNTALSITCKAQMEPLKCIADVHCMLFGASRELYKDRLNIQMHYFKQMPESYAWCKKLSKVESAIL